MHGCVSISLKLCQFSLLEFEQALIETGQDVDALAR